MAFRSLLRLVALALAALLLVSRQPGSFAQTPKAAAPHRIAVFEGEVFAGNVFERPIGDGLKVLLEPIASGWILRVVPARGPRGPHDYTELANPPYYSVSPLLVSTDFGFRAQDALAWNPRRFHYAASAASHSELASAYGQYKDFVRGSPAAAAQIRTAESRLALLASQTPEGELTILDAHLEQGTANQTPAVALVALHPNASARHVDQPANAVATPLGRLNWLRFRIRLELPSGFRVDRAVHIDRAGHL